MKKINFIGIVMWSLLSAAIIAFLFIIFLTVELMFSGEIYRKGFVVKKYYEPESTSVGVGTMILPDGSVFPMTTVETNPEKYIVIVEYDRQYVTTKCTPELYNQLIDGERVVFVTHFGKITGIVYHSKIVKSCKTRYE